MSLWWFYTPLVQHDWAASFGQERRLSPPPSFESSDGLLYGNRILSLMPPLHVSSLRAVCVTHSLRYANSVYASNIFANIMLPIFCMTTVIYPLSGLPPSVNAAAGSLEYTKFDAMTLVPPHIEKITSDAELLHYLSENCSDVVLGGRRCSCRCGRRCCEEDQTFHRKWVCRDGHVANTASKWRLAFGALEIYACPSCDAG